MEDKIKVDMNGYMEQMKKAILKDGNFVRVEIIIRNKRCSAIYKNGSRGK